MSTVGNSRQERMDLIHQQKAWQSHSSERHWFFLSHQIYLLKVCQSHWKQLWKIVHTHILNLITDASNPCLYARKRFSLLTLHCQVYFRFFACTCSHELDNAKYKKFSWHNELFISFTVVEKIFDRIYQFQLTV